MTYDVSAQLPVTWRQDVEQLAKAADFRDFPRTPVLSREATQVDRVSRGRVHVGQVQRDLPWLYGFYRGRFLQLARETRTEPVATAGDGRYGVVLNVQRGPDMRFELHVDSNPLTGLLFCTDHGPHDGGELVFAHDPGATGVEAVDDDCSAIRPQAGHLIFFDGRRHPHYARQLKTPTSGSSR